MREILALLGHINIMKRRDQKKYVTFEIDPRLERIWKAIGLTDEERASEMKIIENALIETYEQQIARNRDRMEKMRQKLHDEELSFEQTKKRFGDKETLLHTSSSSSLREQIQVAKEATEQLQDTYKHRSTEFQEVRHQISDLCDKLGVTPEERAGLIEADDDDLSADTLEMLRERCESLEEEYERRKDVMDSLRSELYNLTDELEEEIPEEIERACEFMDNASVLTVSSAIDDFKQIKAERAEQIDYLSDEIGDLYHILAVDPSDRIELPLSPSEKSIKTLASEKEFLDEQKESRLPVVLRELNRAISKLCEYMHVPIRQRPFYYGNDFEEGVRYLTEELERLKQRHIQEKPIFDLIYEVERQQDLAMTTPDLQSRERGAGKRLMEADRIRSRARSRTPKLKRQLFNELVKYRQEHGHDFMFGDVRYIDTLDVSDTESSGSERSPGRDLLLQKIKESRNSPGFRTPRRPSSSASSNL